MSQFQDSLKKVSDYFQQQGTKQLEATRRNARTESAYAGGNRRPAKLLGQQERKQKNQDRARYGQLKSLIADVERSDLGVQINNTLSKYYKDVLADYQNKKTVAEQRKQIASQPDATTYSSAWTSTALGRAKALGKVEGGVPSGWSKRTVQGKDYYVSPDQKQFAEVVTPQAASNSWWNNPFNAGYNSQTPTQQAGTYMYQLRDREKHWDTYQIGPSRMHPYSRWIAADDRWAPSLPSWAVFANPAEEAKRQQQYIDSYTKYINDYNTKISEAALTEQTTFQTTQAEVQATKDQALANLRKKLKEIDLKPKLEAQAESRTKAKPNPADRVRRSTAMTPKVDQPTIFENRPL